jgi:hypothetical protein
MLSFAAGVKCHSAFYLRRSTAFRLFRYTMLHLSDFTVDGIVTAVAATPDVMLAGTLSHGLQVWRRGADGGAHRHAASVDHGDVFTDALGGQAMAAVAAIDWSCDASACVSSTGKVSIVDLARAACADSFQCDPIGEVLSAAALPGGALSVTGEHATLLLDPRDNSTRALKSLGGEAAIGGAASSERGFAIAHACGAVALFDLRSTSEPLTVIPVPDQLTAFGGNGDASLVCGTVAGRIVTLRGGLDDDDGALQSVLKEQFVVLPGELRSAVTGCATADGALVVGDARGHAGILDGRGSDHWAFEHYGTVAVAASGAPGGGQAIFAYVPHALDCATHSRVVVRTWKH